MSEWVQTHLPCPCGQSSDAYSINDKGWGKCFSCGKNFNEEASDSTPRGKQQVAAVKELVPFGEYRALSKRKITEETCKKFGYFVGEFKEQTVQVAPYRNTDGEVIAQKVRFADKSFTTRGKFKGASNQISPSMPANQSPPLPLPEPVPPA